MYSHYWTNCPHFSKGDITEEFGDDVSCPTCLDQLGVRQRNGLVENRLESDVAAEQYMQPTVLTHAPNCALVKSLVADCDCHLAKSHSG